MNFRWTLLLILLNAAVFGTLLFVEKPWLDEEPGAADSGRLIPVDVHKIKTLEIRPTGDLPAQVLTRARDTWSLEKPIAWPANPFAVNRILNQIQFAERETSFALADLERSGIPLDEYGLAEPRLILTLGWEGYRREIAVGAAAGMRNRLYVLDRETGLIHVVDRSFFEALSLGLNELRSDTIFDLPVYEINSFSMEMTDPDTVRLRLVRSGDRWLFEAPFQGRADFTTTNGTLSQLVRLKVGDFFSHAPDDLERYGLDRPRMRVVLESPNDRQTLLIGGEAETVDGTRKVYAKLSGRQTVFSVAARSLDELRNARYVLRDRQILLLDQALLTGITIKGPDEAIEIELRRLDSAQWQAVARRPETETVTQVADPEILQGIIQQLQQLRARDFPSDAPSAEELAQFGLDQPQRRITLQTDPAITLLVGDNTGSRGQNVFLRVVGEPFVYEVDSAFLRSFPLSPGYYRDRVLLDQPSGMRIRALTLRQPATGEILFHLNREDPDQPWSEVLEAETDLSAEMREAIQLLIVQSRRFRVNNYTTVAFSGEGILLDDEHPWTLALETDFSLAGSEEDERQLQTLLFTDRIGGTVQFGGWPPEELVFSLRQSTIDALHTVREWIDAQPREIAPEVTPEEESTEAVDPDPDPDPAPENVIPEADNPPGTPEDSPPAETGGE